MAKGLFPAKAYPACRNCALGHASNDGRNILCTHKGIVGPDFSCKKYRYDPLRRVPKRMPPLPAYDSDDFKL